MNNRILILAPHADDETLGCGGVIARYVEEGDEVFVAILTNAAKGAPELFTDNDVASIRLEALEAHKLLGVHKTFFLDLPAPCLELYPQYKIANEIVKIINEVKPCTVFAPHRGDLHLDHAAIFNAAVVATRPQGNYTVKNLFCYETLSETDWGHPFAEAAFIPNVFFKLTEEQLQKKLAAMSCFVSQLKEFPHSRTLLALESLARLRGATVGAVAAEAFVNVRQIF